MTVSAFSRTLFAGLGLAAVAAAAPASAQAQDAYPQAGPLDPAPMDEADVRALPPEYRTGPAVYRDSETIVGPDGVETITRTRRIESRGPDYAGSEGYYEAGTQYPAYAQNYGYSPTSTVFEREEWIDECERRTNGYDDREKGGIIGGLLGAIAGGIAGNRIADAGDRLGGTLIGAGVGGLGGLLIGSLIGGGRDRDGDYDCEAALDSYLSQYGHPGAYAPPYRVAARTIPAPAYAPPVQYGYGQAYPSYGYGYSYAPPQQIVYVPVTYQQQQRVIVRETVREEVIPGARRVIPAPPPAPRPIKTQPIPIKGN